MIALKDAVAPGALLMGGLVLVVLLVPVTIRLVAGRHQRTQAPEGKTRHG
jgi:hypothetical protein